MGNLKKIDAHLRNWRPDDVPWLVGPMQLRIFGPCEPIRLDDPVSKYLAYRPVTGGTHATTPSLDHLGDGSDPEAIAREIATFDKGARAN